ncbi:MAG: hypothetical protein GC206_08550 [Alphaproteobacteria bacterium]|nr:hypothetical protein [Alphaproteobacteria bacterium]
MSHPGHAIDWRSIQRLAQHEARRLRRSLGLPVHDLADLRQELLVDLIARLPAYNPAKAEIGAFARVCFRHAALRIAAQHARRRRAARTVFLDDPLPGAEGLTLADLLTEGESYAAWLGQPTDPIAALERRLDLEGAAAVISPEDFALCAALGRHTPHELGAQGGMPRMRIYRRIRELRLQMLAAGIPSAA